MVNRVVEVPIFMDTPVEVLYIYIYIYIYIYSRIYIYRGPIFMDTPVEVLSPSLSLSLSLYIYIYIYLHNFEVHCVHARARMRAFRITYMHFPIPMGGRVRGEHARGRVLYMAEAESECQSMRSTLNPKP
jgi:hypothetical protein